jgi:hypothetical protein
MGIARVQEHRLLLLYFMWVWVWEAARLGVTDLGCSLRFPYVFLTRLFWESNTWGALASVARGVRPARSKYAISHRSTKGNAACQDCLISNSTMKGEVRPQYILFSGGKIVAVTFPTADMQLCWPWHVLLLVIEKNR